MAPYCFADGRNKNSEGERLEVRGQIADPFRCAHGTDKNCDEFIRLLHKIAQFFCRENISFLKEFQPENCLVCFFQHDS